MPNLRLSLNAQYTPTYIQPSVLTVRSQVAINRLVLPWTASGANCNINHASPWLATDSHFTSCLCLTTSEQAPSDDCPPKRRRGQRLTALHNFLRLSPL